jgi:hypothetical protein
METEGTTYELLATTTRMLDEPVYITAAIFGAPTVTTGTKLLFDLYQVH